MREEENFIHLNLQWLNEAVAHPWADVINSQQAAPANIYYAFRHAHRALLILGAPGAGKTVSLVELAEYLLTIVATDPTQPIPVVLNLTNWAGKQLDIVTWVVEEMVAKYQIPRRMGRAWLTQDQLLLLFDGLDEMNPAYRAESVAALNAFRQEHGLVDIAVCCRKEAYETLVALHETRLVLNEAVLIRPLTITQIKENTAPDLAEILFRDDDLLEMAQTPLVLHMIQAAYGGEFKLG